MPRYRFAVEYLGTSFSGWQIQAGQPSVQEELQRALKVCLREDVDVVGAGRTDAGVHASGQVAHFDCAAELEPRRVQHSVNALTAQSVYIRRMEACPADFHARYRAVSRLYRYRIALRPTALHGHLSWYTGYTLDPELLRGELSDVIGIHDFVNFSVPREDGKSTDCEVLRAEAETDGIFLVITLEANRFLHKMVRSIVGAGFEVARKARPAGLIREILAERRPRAGQPGSTPAEWTWAPPHGLCLEKVAYEDYEY